jgi:multicomponent Na+:H+ antiporter subunit C
VISSRIYLVASAVLLCIGLFWLLRHENLIRRLLALNTMTSAIFLFLVATAYGGGVAPPDPVPHAMVLTGIVVAVSATAVALALIRRLHQQTGSVRLDPEDETEPGDHH